MALATIRKLSGLGILGINQRNAEYILLHNSRRSYPLVDNKLRTKQLAEALEIPVPKLLKVIEIQRQTRDLTSHLLQYEEGFVVKPAMGSGGEGIVVITGLMKDYFRRAGGTLMDADALRYHISRVLTGVFSLGGHPDIALIESRVDFDPLFENVTYAGVPDIRLIAFHGVPVMAMVRLPTRLSDGKANLHQGAIGVGIDLATGVTLSGVWRDLIITDHPDTGHQITGISIPYWDDILLFASRCYDMTGLGYQGVDIVLDRERGPLLLELNARPGLNIQIANRVGLSHRLKLVEKHRDKLSDEKARIQFAQENFLVESQETHT